MLPTLDKQGIGPRCQNRSRPSSLIMFLKNDLEIDCECGHMQWQTGQIDGIGAKVSSF